MRDNVFPGFTADASLRKSTSRYRSSFTGAGSVRSIVTVLGDDKYCPAGHCEIDCGIWGPYHAETNCGPGQRGHCWCGSGGAGWGQGFCECQPDPHSPPPQSSLSTTCSVPSTPYSCDFGGAWVSGTDPGCTATCSVGYKAVCNPWTCDGTQWKQSTCYCALDLRGVGDVFIPPVLG